MYCVQFPEKGKILAQHSTFVLSMNMSVEMFDELYVTGQVFD